MTFAPRFLTPETRQRLAAGLDLTTSDDRAILRGRVETLLELATFACLREYAAGEGGVRPVHTRWEAYRAIADRLIECQTPTLPTPDEATR